MKFATLVLAIFLVGPSPATLNAEIYSWTDENGVKHYGNVPPPDTDNVKVEFKEYQHNQKADQQRSDVEQEEMEGLIRDIERDNRNAEAAEKKRAEAAKKNQPPTREQLIEDEKKRLQDLIIQLEEAPLDRYGSQRNKILTIGFYKNRLQALLENPDKYFSEPVSFEGNVQNPEATVVKD
jgi:hypothetical protein